MSSFIVPDRRGQRLVIYGTAFASFMVNIDTYIVNISLPTMANDLGASTAEIAWASLSYQLAVTGFLLFFGRLGDRLGLKRVFLLGFALFTASSLLCGLAPTLGWLVAARFLQGIGASVLYALTPAMIPRFLPPAERAPAYATLATFTALGMALGSPVGGLITGWLNWHWIFHVNVPVGLVALVVCHRILPDDDVPRAERRGDFDLPAALLAFLGPTAFIYAVSDSSEHALVRIPHLTAILLLSALVMLALFLRRESRRAAPLVDLSLFRSPAFAWGNLASGLTYAFMAGTNFLMPFYLMDVRGFNAQTAGGIYFAGALVYLLASAIAGRLFHRFTPRQIGTAGLAFGAASAFWFSHVLTSDSLLLAWVAPALFSLTFGCFAPANNAVVMSAAPAGQEGSVAGVFRMIMRLGLVAGLCFFEVIFHAGGGSETQPSDKAAMLVGFHYAYVAGGFTCLAALIASLLAHSAEVKKA